MTDQTHVHAPFLHSRILTWLLGIFTAVLILIRENPPVDMNGAIDLIGYAIGAAALTAVFKWLIEKFFFKKQTDNNHGMYLWNIGIALYIIFFLLSWLLLSR